jgi:hypothetical protein
MDMSVLDFLMGNLDRHHYETFSVKKSVFSIFFVVETSTLTSVEDYDGIQTRRTL